jgi:hypothetical protein
VLTDLRRYRQWHPTLELLDGPPGGQLATGTVLRQRANRGTSTERAFEVSVAEMAQPLTLAWEGGDPQVFFGRHRFTLSPEAGAPGWSTNRSSAKPWRRFCSPSTAQPWWPTTRPAWRL